MMEIHLENYSEQRLVTMFPYRLASTDRRCAEKYSVEKKKMVPHLAVDSVAKKKMVPH